MPVRINESLRIGVLLLLAVITYLLFYGFYGWGDTDHGFIQALSYRITLGEVPYRDFIYVRPPLTPYLHSISQFLLPPHLQTLSERFLFFFFCGANVWLATLTLRTRFDFRQIGISPEFFAIIAFVFTVHNFPPMPWHTVDGILFGSLGLYLISASKRWSIAYLGLFALLLAAMSKQSFYPMLLAGPVLIWILRGGRPALKSSLAFGLTCGALILSVYLLDPELLQAFVQQTSGSGSWNDLFIAGVQQYLKALFIVVLPLLMIRELNNKYEILAWFRDPMLLLFGLAMAGLLALTVFRSISQETHTPPSFGFGQACLLLTVLIALKGMWINPRSHSLLLSLVFLAWCSGLSWGYLSPMLFFTPLLFGCLYIAHQELDFVAPRYFYGIVLVLVAWVFALLYQYPYRDVPREQMNYKAGTIFPALSYVYTGEPLYRKCEELARFSQEYEGSFTVFPAFPLAHYLTQQKPVFPVDWAHNVEMGFTDNGPELIQILDTEVAHVFMERDKLDQLDIDTRYGSGISAYVQANWQLIQSGEFFDVYAPPPAALAEDGMVYADTLQIIGTQTD